MSRLSYFYKNQRAGREERLTTPGPLKKNVASALDHTGRFLAGNPHPGPGIWGQFSAEAGAYIGFNQWRDDKAGIIYWDGDVLPKGVHYLGRGFTYVNVNPNAQIATDETHYIEYHKPGSKAMAATPTINDILGGLGSLGVDVHGLTQAVDSIQTQVDNINNTVDNTAKKTEAATALPFGLTAAQVGIGLIVIVIGFFAWKKFA